MLQHRRSPMHPSKCLRQCTVAISSPLETCRRWISWTKWDLFFMFKKLPPVAPPVLGGTSDGISPRVVSWIEEGFPWLADSVHVEKVLDCFPE